MLRAPGVFLAFSCALVSACKPGPQSNQAPAGNIQTDSQKLGYSIGFDMGRSLVPIKDGIDTKALEEGIEEALAQQQSRIPDDQRQLIKSNLTQKLRNQQVEGYQVLIQKNKSESEKFLADNAQRSGVRTTASGLQYEVLREGRGDHPTPKDKVVVNYVGTLVDGTAFDNTYDRHQPATLPVAAVIPGWGEGLQMMAPGSKYKLYIPANLAYGDRGAPPQIGPDAALVFEVELLSVEKYIPPAKASSAPKP